VGFHQNEAESKQGADQRGFAFVEHGASIPEGLPDFKGAFRNDAPD
jgi:hypothetical protein